MGDVWPCLRYLHDPVAFARERLASDPDEKQALVLRADARRGILNCSRQWGESTVTATKAVHRALFQPKALVIVVSPTERQSTEFLRKAAEFLRRLDIRVQGDGGNRKSILAPNGLAPGGAARRGGQRARVLGGEPSSGGELWLMSTPFGQRGFFWETWERGGRESLRVSVPATECSRISAEFLEKQRAALGERWYRQEYLCEFTQPDDALFDEEMLRDVLD